MIGKIKKFLREVKAEIKKVNWPGRQELVSYTGIVIVSIVIVAIFIGIVDLIFSFILTPLL